ncbi:MAG: TonB-dependent receptor [Caulobacteraceae bacterium]
MSQSHRVRANPSAIGKRRTALLATASALILASAALPAFAQDDAATVNEVVVTGTLIRGIAPVGAPVISLGQQEILKSGYLDTTSVLKTVPQISYLGISESTTGTTANGNGTNTTAGSGVNIRGLGQQATLTLINGHRGAPGGQFGNYFEPSNVPTIALSGIEILTDGASAIYGSDAIAGVVNLILRKNYNGIEARAGYSSANGYNAHDFSVLLGKTWSTGSITVSAERNYHSTLMAADRPNLFIADAPKTFAGNGALPRGFVNFSPNANIRTGAGTAANPFVYYAVPYGATNASQVQANTQNIVGAWYASNALPEQTRDAYSANFEQKVGEIGSIYGQALYSRRQWEVVGGAGGGTLAVNSTLTVPSTNPYFITGLPGVTTSETVLLSQFNTLGAQIFHGREMSYQGVLGATVKLPGGWQLDVNGERAANRVSRLRFNTANTCGLTGGNAATCVTPAGETAGLGTIGQTNPALAFNPFGPNNAYVLGRVRATDLQQGAYDSDIVTAKVDGRVFTLPGGDVRAALGFEYRNDSEGQFNTTQSTAPSSTQNIQIGTSKSMTVKSLFGEVVIPLVGDGNTMPLIKKLEVSVAGRYADYNILAKSTTNPKVGVTWKPSDDLKISGSYSTSFRVNLASTDINNAPLLRIRTITDYLGPGGTSNAVQRGGGNPELAPETSRTWTFGGEWRPSNIKGLNVGLTYFNIRYQGVIDTPGAAVLNAVTASSESIYGAFITRRPSTVTPGASDAAFNTLVAQLQASSLFTGAVIAPVNLIIDARSQNAGVIETDGLDFNIGYKWDTAWGGFDAALLGEYYFKYNRSLTPTGVLTPRLDLIDFPQKYRVRGQFGWTYKGLNATLFANYTPSYTNTYPTPFEKVNSYLTFDLGVRYNLGDTMSNKLLHDIAFSVNVQNLFDKTPPYVAEFNQNFDSSITSMLGRVVTVQLSKKF